MKKKRIMIDPPSGWKYGFPKVIPEDMTDLRQWFIDSGYPESEVDFAMKHCRQWEAEDED